MNLWDRRHKRRDFALQPPPPERLLKEESHVLVWAETLEGGDRAIDDPVVVRGADGMDLFDIAAEISRLSDGARAGKIALQDLQGGTFTITSTGNIGASIIGIRANSGVNNGNAGKATVINSPMSNSVLYHPRCVLGGVAHRAGR